MRRFFHNLIFLGALIAWSAIAHAQQKIITHQTTTVVNGKTVSINNTKDTIITKVPSRSTPMNTRANETEYEKHFYQGLYYTIEAENGVSYAVLAGRSSETPTELSIPNKAIIDNKEYSVKKIADATFNMFGTLTKVTIPNTVTAIGNYAFENCTNLEEVVIYDSSNLENIGNYAFLNCPKLEKFNIPAKVKSVGYAAFEECENLEEITCHAETPPSISWNFRVSNKDHSWKKVIIYVPEKSLEAYTDNYSNWYASGYRGYNYFFPIGNKAEFYTSTNGNEYVINRTTQKAILSNGVEKKNITIPASVTVHSIQFPITEISEDCFYNFHNVESIELPATIEKISDYPFGNCENLTLLTVHATTPPATYGNYNLHATESFKISDSHHYAQRTHLVIHVPSESVDAYNHSAWKGTTNYIYPMGNKQSIQKISGCKYLIDSEANYTTLLRTYKTVNYKIPANITFEGKEYAVTHLGPECFDIYSPQEPKIPEAIKVLDAYCFFGNDSITNVVVPNFVTFVEHQALSYCGNLKSVDLPETITSVGSYCFSESKKLEKVTCRATTPPSCYSSMEPNASAILYVPETSINTYKSTNYWKEFNDILAIGSDQGSGSTIGQAVADNFIFNVKKEGYASFAGFNGTPQQVMEVPSIITYNGTSYPITVLETDCFNDDNIEEIVLPSSIKTIHDFAWENCSNLKSVTLLGAPPTTENLGNALYVAEKTNDINTGEATQVESHLLIFVPQEELDAYKAANWDKYYGTYLYSENEKANVSIKRIFGYKFLIRQKEQTAALLRIYKDAQNKLPNAVILDGTEFPINSLGYQAIINQEYNGESINFPKHLTTLEDYAVWACKSITTLNIPNGVTSIGVQAISNCETLEAIDLPVTLEKVANYSFVNNKNMKKIICRAVTPPSVMNLEIFTGEYKPQPDWTLDAYPLYVPASSVAAYKADDYWGKYKTILSIDDTSNIKNISTAENVSITSTNGTICVKGLQEGESVSIYNAIGLLLGNTTVNNGVASFDLGQQTSIVIIKVKGNTIKYIMQ